MADIKIDVNDASVSDEKQACSNHHPAKEEVSERSSSNTISKLEEHSKTSDQEPPFRKARVSVRARSEAPMVLLLILISFLYCTIVL